MVTTLYLVRHGETEGSDAKRYKGSIDVPLSTKGVVQMREAAGFIVEHLHRSCEAKSEGYLRDVHAKHGAWKDERRDGMPETTHLLSAVYCSHLSRALKSAEVVAEPFGLTPIPAADFRERHFGVWEGMTFLEIRERYPEEFEAWASNPLEHSPPGGESTLEVRDRVSTAIDEVLSRHAGENISVIAHGGVNRVILCGIMGMPLEHMFRIEQDCGCVNIIEFWDRYPVVKLLNGGSRG
jgi:broad specificity phosphatase PhoE